MAILNFPVNPVDGQLYPVPCPTGVTQYKWEASTQIWRIVGVATGVNPGTYGNSVTVGSFSVDVQGIITDADNIPIRPAGVGLAGIVPLNDTTTSVSITQALTARAGKFLQDQIGNLSSCIVPQSLNVVQALNYLQGQINRVDTESLVWCGYYNATDGYISYVSTAGAASGFVIGEELPNPGFINSGCFFIVNLAGNPFLAGDFNAPNEFCPVGSWIYQDRNRWIKVDTGTSLRARDVSFDNRGSCFTATNVQNALQQVCAYLRQPIGGATISEYAPENPYQGQLWWDSDDGYFYIYYRDGNGAQWVEIGGGGSEALTAGGGTVYEVSTGVGLTGGPIITEGTISLVPATNTLIGGVYVPDLKGLDLRKDGRLSLRPCTDSLIGGIIVGDGLSIDPDGRLSVKGGGSTTADDVSVREIPGISTADTVQQALEAIEIQAQDRIEAVNVLDEGLLAEVTQAVFTSNDGTILKLTPVRANVGRVGVVSLTNALDGNSESLALSQKAGNILQSEISALVGVNVLAGTYNAATGKMTYVTPAGASRGFQVGQNCPPASQAIDNYYVIVTIGGNYAPPGTSGPASPYDWFICQADAGTLPVWFLIDFPSQIIDAANVALAPIKGLSATNVQDGISQVQLNAESRTKTVSSAVGLTVAYNSLRNCQIDLIAATPDNLGGVYVLPNRGIKLGTDGGLSLDPPSTDGIIIGGVKAGLNVTIEPDGTLNAKGGGETAADIYVDPLIPGIDAARNVQAALELVELQAQDRVEYVLPEPGSTGLNVRQTDPVKSSFDGTTVYLSVDRSTTSQPGIVQLTNDITGSSELIAPTQKSISVLNAKVDALTGANVLAGTYSALTGTVATTTAAGQKAGFIVGKNCPLAKNVPDNYYVIVTTGGGFGPVGATIPAGGVQPGDWFICENASEIAEPAWVTIDYDQRTVSAQNVAVSPIQGFAATNAQTAFEEVITDLNKTFTSIYSFNNGITVKNDPNSSLFGFTSGLTLNPANSFDIGGVIVPPNNGLNVSGNGTLTLSVASATQLGGIKVGENLTIDPDGTLNSVASGGVKSITFQSPLTGGTVVNTGVVGIQNATATQSGAMTAAFAAKLDSLGTNGVGQRTVSDQLPTGGNNGDIWYVV